MLILSRAPNDEFTLRLFVQACDYLKVKDAYYIWSLSLNPYSISELPSEEVEMYVPDFKLEPGIIEDKDRNSIIFKVERHRYERTLDSVPNYYQQLIKNNISNDHVVIGLKDHLTPGEFNPWYESEPALLYYLNEIFEYHKDKKFTLFTSLENLDLYNSYSNVTVIPWGGDITNQISLYKNIAPVIDKNIKSKYTFLSLNRHKRNHRLHLLSFLAEKQYLDYGLISCIFKDRLESFEESEWWFYNDQTDVQENFKKGLTILKNYDFPIKDDYDIYKDLPNNNVGNFQRTLKNYYKEVFVEFVSETSYTESCFLITEKTANSILGCCFPIWVSSKGTVEFLRSIGLDVFDDIIDHSYDQYENPFERLISAIELNRTLLVDNNRTKGLWVKNKDRFLRNVDFLKFDLEKFYIDRVRNMIKIMYEQ
jgi:hypothetical protein